MQFDDAVPGRNASLQHQTGVALKGERLSIDRAMPPR